MFSLRALRRPPRQVCLVRNYAAKPGAPAPPKLSAKADATVPAVEEPLSSCAPNTVLEGLNYLKDQPPVLALPDEEYPPWLWDTLKTIELVDDGPGGKAEKARLRRENRKRIRDANFMKMQ
ncbi:hypothetical protein BV25DRAFT_1869213 [Artomyces pyxidatus]|uniref:Uncharacterized protein n=1 Tax=Artomyces pyxidatus TaxID=48021 RepID=A0ACB8T914_9AGAM|nr:hypothetical protein BV25DRAFT_1869213 [Artomyces pyxidatus]